MHKGCLRVPPCVQLFRKHFRVELHQDHTGSAQFCELSRFRALFTLSEKMRGVNLRIIGRGPTTNSLAAASYTERDLARKMSK